MEDKSNPPHRILVWDRLVRLGHWTIVISFITGYLFTKKFPVHAYAGYVIFALVCLRIVWGFIGTDYARFSAFTYGLKETWHYAILALRFGDAKEYLSHNPMGAVMVFVMIGSLLLNTIVGAMLYGAQQATGPFEDVVPFDWEDTLLVIHGGIAKLLLGLAAMHVAGVILASWWHRQNYIMAMITGYKSPYARRKKRSGNAAAAARERQADQAGR